MRYSDVCIQAIHHVLPERVVTTAAIESWLKPLYERLHLPEGRLELMTGIRERRFWPKGKRPSEASAEAGEGALQRAGLKAGDVDCLLHCSVSRDFVEPATSTAVHRLLGLPGTALNFDISNACLGVLSGMLMVANMIQLGQIETGLVVSGENGGPLVEGTVERLLRDETLTRRSIKPEIASLTIGSAAAAIVLSRRSSTPSGARLLGGAHWCDTTQNHLCQGSADSGMGDGSRPVMHTDSPELLQHGVEVAARTWTATCDELGWDADTPDVICTHQVGKAHTDLMLGTLGLDPGRNVPTYETLGNCGSASLPVTLSVAEKTGRIEPGQQVALLGIGSGINCTMLGLDYAPGTARCGRPSNG